MRNVYNINVFVQFKGKEKRAGHNPPMIKYQGKVKITHCTPPLHVNRQRFRKLLNPTRSLQRALFWRQMQHYLAVPRLHKSYMHVRSELSTFCRDFFLNNLDRCIFFFPSSFFMDANKFFCIFIHWGMTIGHS